MDERTLRQHLAESQNHIVEDKRHIARQRELISQLQRHGRDASAAMEFFDSLLRSYAKHQQHREWLLKTLEHSFALSPSDETIRLAKGEIALGSGGLGSRLIFRSERA